jgi:hypothetical protein
MPNPCVRRETLPVLKLRVTGKSNAHVQRKLLRESGNIAVGVKRTNWFS